MTTSGFADGPTELVRQVVGAPYWHDLTRAAGRGLALMRVAATRAEAELRVRVPDLPSRRSEVLAALAVLALEDPIAAWHAALAAAPAGRRVLAPDGSACAPLYVADL